MRESCKRSLQLALQCDASSSDSRTARKAFSQRCARLYVALAHFYLAVRRWMANPSASMAFFFDSVTACATLVMRFSSSCVRAARRQSALPVRTESERDAERESRTQTHRLELGQVLHAGDEPRALLADLLAVRRELDAERLEGLARRVAQRAQALLVLGLRAGGGRACAAEGAGPAGRARGRTWSGALVVASSSRRWLMPSSRSAKPCKSARCESQARARARGQGEREERKGTHLERDLDDLHDLPRQRRRVVERCSEELALLCERGKSVRERAADGSTRGREKAEEGRAHP